MDNAPEPTTVAGETQPEPGPPEGLAGGVLDGGWSYIWAAYIMTWSFLLAYAVYVNVVIALRSRRAREQTR